MLNIAFSLFFMYIFEVKKEYFMIHKGAVIFWNALWNNIHDPKSNRKKNLCYLTQSNTICFVSNIGDMQNKKADITSVQDILNYTQSNEFYNITGFSNIDNFYAKLYIKSNNSDRKNLLKIMHKVIYSYNIKNLFEFLLITKKELSEEDFLVVWNNIHPSLLKINSYNDDFNKVLDFIKNEFKEKEDEYLYLLIKNNAKKLSLGEKTSIKMKDFLIEKYAHDKEKLKRYSDCLPIINLYFSVSVDDSYIENEYIKETFYIELNCEKLKAIVSIPGWKVINYFNNLKFLMDKIFSKYPEIRDFKLSKHKSNKKEYIGIYVAKEQINGISKVFLEKIILAYFKDLLANYDVFSKNPTMRANYVDKWLHMFLLTQKLNKNNSGDKKEIRKI